MLKAAVAIFIFLAAVKCYEVVASEGRLIKWCIRAFNNIITFILTFSESDSITLIKSGWTDNSLYQEPLRGRDGRNGTQGPQGVNGHDGRNGTEGRKGRKGPKGERGRRGKPGQKKGGVVYTHWGNDSCSDNTTDTEILYEGIVVGSGRYYNYYGGGANYLCLPKEGPQNLSTTYNGNQAYLHGTEYDSPILSVNKNENVPCAVCYTPTKTVQLMIPGRLNCSSSWTKEYEGYLMTARFSEYANQNFICVDKEAQSVLTEAKNMNGPLLYHVTARCSGIPCPPYEDNKYITCVVCTK